MAKLYFRYGAMGSSKTANLLMTRYNYLEKGKKPLLLKPKIENRDGEKTQCRICHDQSPGERSRATGTPGPRKAVKSL